MPETRTSFQPGNQASVGRPDPLPETRKTRGFFKALAAELLKPSPNADPKLDWRGLEELKEVMIKMLKRGDPNAAVIIRDMAQYLDGKPLNRVLLNDPQDIKIALVAGDSAGIEEDTELPVRSDPPQTNGDTPWT